MSHSKSQLPDSFRQVMSQLKEYIGETNKLAIKNQNYPKLLEILQEINEI